MTPVPLIATAVALLVLFLLAELARRRDVPPETTRRFVHIAGAGTTALFPLYLTLGDVVILGGVFTIVLVGTRLTGWLPSVHAVARPTWGAVVFPAGLVLAALVVWSQAAAFSYAALVLAFADPAASVLGQRLRSPTWSVAGGTKSLAGSAAFVVVAFLIGTVFALANGKPPYGGAALAGAVLCVVEGTTGYGLDNLFIPVIAGVLGEQWLRL